MDLEKIEAMLANIKKDIIEAVEEKLEKKLENTLEKVSTSVKNNEMVINEINKRKIPIKL